MYDQVSRCFSCAGSLYLRTFEQVAFCGYVQQCVEQASACARSLIGYTLFALELDHRISSVHLGWSGVAVQYMQILVCCICRNMS